jgi:hypothetical protein
LLGLAEFRKAFPFPVGNQACGREFIFHPIDVSTRVETTETMNEFLLSESKFTIRRWGRDFQKEVEVVRHDTTAPSEAL